MKKSEKLGFKKKLGLKLYKQYKKTETELHILKYFFWETTLRCNLNCIHCGSDCRIDSNVKDMHLEDFLKVVDEVATTVNPNKTMIVLTGGEPLVRKDLELAGKEFFKRGFPWGMVTNGYLLTQQKFNNLFNSGLRSLTISLDGFEDEHDWFRGRNGAFKNASAAIQIVAKSAAIKFDVVTCVNQKSIHILTELKDQLIEWGVKEWRLFTVFPVGRAKDNELLLLDDNQFVEMMEFIKNTRKEGRIKASYGCEGFLGKYEVEVRDEFFFCRAGINVGSVLADGSISACPSLRENFIQGNIYNDSFVDVWENKFQIMRDRSWTKAGVCNKCDVYEYCEGNGLHLRTENPEELLFCHYEKIKNTTAI